MKSLTTLIATLLLATIATASPQIDIQVQAPLQSDTDNAFNQRAIDRYHHYFGRVLLHSSAHATYRLTNTGTTPLTFQTASISGIGYSASHNCTGLLMPHQTCEFSMRFRPTMEGFRSGRFILSFVENLDIWVSLTGEGYRY